jgi:hypothetical protein
LHHHEDDDEVGAVKNMTTLVLGLHRRGLAEWVVREGREKLGDGGCRGRDDCGAR